MDDFEILIFQNKDMVKAAQFGRFDLVQELMNKHDVKPNFQVLEAAVSEGHTKLVDYLLTECMLYPKKQIVYTATRKNYMGIMYRLLKDSRVNAEIIFYNSLYAGNVEMVDYILKNNYIDDPVEEPVNVHWKAHYSGRNSAIITAMDKGFTEIVRVMLENEKIRSNLEPKLFTHWGFKHESIGKLLWPYLKDQITDKNIHDCMAFAIRMDLDTKSLDFLFDKLKVPISLDVAERILKGSGTKDYFSNKVSIYSYDEFFDEDNTFRYFLKRITPILGQLFDRYMEDIEDIEECFSPDLVLSLIDNGLELTTERFIEIIRVHKLSYETRDDKIYLIRSIFVKFVDDPRIDITYDDHYLFWISIHNEKNERVMESLLKRISNIPRNFRERIDLYRVSAKIIVCLARAGCYPLNELFQTNERMKTYQDQQYLLTNLLKFPGLTGERPNYPYIWSEVLMKEQETLKKIKPLYKHLVGTSPIWQDLFRQILEYLPEVVEDSSLEGTRMEIINRWIQLCLG